MFKLQRAAISISIIVLVCICHTYSQSENHESPHYQIFFINERNTGVFLITGRIDFRNKLLEVECMSTEFITASSINLYTGKIIGDFEKLEILDTLIIPPSSITNSEPNIFNFPVNNIQRGNKIVIWSGNEISDGKSKLITSADILEHADIIYSEQTRLSLIGVNKNKENLILEVYRNQTE